MKTLKQLASLDRAELTRLLAEFDGWEFCERARTRYGRPNNWTTPHCRHPRHTSGIWRRLARLTDYTYDLNACHEIEKTLSSSIRLEFKDSLYCQRSFYICTLMDVINKQPAGTFSWPAHGLDHSITFSLTHANAHQRSIALAFLFQVQHLN